MRGAASLSNCSQHATKSSALEPVRSCRLGQTRTSGLRVYARGRAGPFNTSCCDVNLHHGVTICPKVKKREACNVAQEGEALIFAGSYGNLIPTPPFEEVAPDTPSVLTHAFGSFVPFCANALAKCFFLPTLCVRPPVLLRNKVEMFGARRGRRLSRHYLSLFVISGKRGRRLCGTGTSTSLGALGGDNLLAILVVADTWGRSTVAATDARADTRCRGRYVSGFCSWFRGGRSLWGWSISSPRFFSARLCQRDV